MKTIEGIKLLTISETAQVLGLCEHTIRRHIKGGKLNSVQLGQTFIKVSDICEKLGVESIDLTRFEEN
jgi:excisionase family DNA binding protein